MPLAITASRIFFWRLLAAPQCVLPAVTKNNYKLKTGATSQHREVDCRQVLHRRGGVRRITAPQWKKYSCAEEFLLLRTPVNSRPDRQETDC